MKELIYLLALKNIKGIGDIFARRLLKRFGTPESVFNSNMENLLEIEGINLTLARSIKEFSDWNGVRKEAELIHKKGIEIVKYNDSDYPPNLKNIYNYPLFLYYLGQINTEDNKALAVVGSRDCDDYGIKITETVVSQLSEMGVTVISGLARGIDTVAHKSALKSDGRTVAVLGNGIDICYPSENKTLFKKISESGYIISEYPLGTKPESKNFPKRNRLISGLSLGVIVIQANKDSGALITADYSNEQNREVFAIPGNIDNKRNYGSNQLIKNGAKLVENIDDIVEEIGEFKTLTNTKNLKNINMTNITGEEKIVFQHLLGSKLHIDQIVYKTNIDFIRLFSLLLNMEMKGIVKSFPGNYYQVLK
ncbi:MAG: DNA-processing protein DprA [Thermodesulfobacteriota bacterium]